jgi:hypothetical protein
MWRLLPQEARACLYCLLTPSTRQERRISNCFKAYFAQVLPIAEDGGDKVTTGIKQAVNDLKLVLLESADKLDNRAKVVESLDKINNEINKLNNQLQETNK